MVSLSEKQLATVMTATAGIDPERRDIFLQRIGAMLKLCGRFIDADISDVAQLARLVHHAAA